MPGREWWRPPGRRPPRMRAVRSATPILEFHSLRLRHAHVTAITEVIRLIADAVCGALTNIYQGSEE
jgi:hypothetical protein